jgi:hypothetical protein
MALGLIFGGAEWDLDHVGRELCGDLLHEGGLLLGYFLYPI